MRWIFITLVLLNLLVFGVQWKNGFNASEPPRAAEQFAGNSAQRIMLVQDPQRTGEGGAQGSAARASASRGTSILESMPSRSVGADDELCFAAGPMQIEADAQRLIAALRSSGIEVRLVSRDVKRAPDYWVYMPPYETRDQAVNVLRELQQVHRIDSFLISEGPLSNGISLGLFKNKDAAVALQAQRQEQGFPAKLAEVERLGTEFWGMFVTKPSPDRINIVQNILSAEKIQADLQYILCEGVASSEKVP